jgi:hypothetical protein
MTWSRQQYEDAIRAHLGDLGVLQHIDDTRIPLALRRALATFSKDKPRVTTAALDGTGTARTFDLTAEADWQTGWSRVETVEHPTGQIPKDYLDSHTWEVDDETGTITFNEAPAAGTGNLRVRYTTTWPMPDDDPSDDTAPLHDVFAEAIAELAASIIIRGVANEYARQQSTSVQGNLYVRNPTDLYAAAGSLKKAYEETVLGRPAGAGTASAVAIAVTDVDVFPDSLFHTRQETLDEEDAFSA